MNRSVQEIQGVVLNRDQVAELLGDMVRRVEGSPIILGRDFVRYECMRMAGHHIGHDLDHIALRIAALIDRHVTEAIHREREQRGAV